MPDGPLTGTRPARLAAWAERLKGAPVVLELPFDRIRHRAKPEPDLSDETTRLPVTRRATLPASTDVAATLLAAFAIVLWRYTGQDDMLIAVRGEGLGLSRLDESVVVRLAPSGGPFPAARTTFETLAQRVRAELDQAAASGVTYAELAAVLAPEGAPGHSPLCQAAFVLGAGGAGASERFDLCLRATPSGVAAAGGAAVSADLTVTVDPALAGRSFAERFLGHYLTVLEAALAKPETPVGSLPMIGPEEKRRILELRSGVPRPYPRESTIPELFLSEAARVPDRVALTFGDRNVTYGELAFRAGRLAERLRDLGVGPDVLVGICAERSVEAIVGLVAILLAGGAYVPLDPEYPRERLSFMLSDTACPVLLVDERLAGRLPELPAGATLVHLDGEEAASPAQVSGEAAAAAAQGASAAEVDGVSACAPPTGKAGTRVAGYQAPRVSPDNLAYVIYTSGSTGRPKGVAVPHRAVVRLVKEADYARISEDEVFLQFAPVSFDASTLEIWGPLLSGGRLVIMPPGAPSLGDLAETIARQAVTTVWLTAGLFNLMIEQEASKLRGLRQLLFGGDVASPAAVRLAYETLPACRLVNGYGPTENTTFTACFGFGGPLGTAPPPVLPIGRPISNTTTYVLDQRLELVPVGVPGELYTGGDGLARGYLGRPDLTAERFVPNPFGEPGSRLYRTGDLVRLLADGNIEFLGRLDHQVKIRGFRIEPGEIEAVLSEHPRVRRCIVVPCLAESGAKRLVAYVIPEGAAAGGGPAEAPSPRELRSFLAERLPDWMVPSGFVSLEAFPLDPNGKVDRSALPDPGAFESTVDYVAPRTHLEEVLAGIWAEVLGLGRVGVDDDFFDLGGDSLLVTQVVARVNRRIGLNLPIRDVFQNPTVAALARAIEAAGSGTYEQGAPTPVPRGRPLPLSYAQERLWFMDQIDPGSPVYNVPTTIRLTGELDIPALEGALAELLRRHEALRTVYVSESGRPCQVILPPAPIRLQVVDLATEAAGPDADQPAGPRAAPPAGASAALERALALATEDTRRPFDLRHDLMLRATLFRLGPGDYLLALVIHHIATDGWSMGILLEELGRIYSAFHRGEPSPLPEPSLQYADFASWQREWLTPDVLAPHLGYWTEKLRGMPSALDLPTDHPRPIIQSSRGALHLFTLPDELSDRLADLARREGATLFMVLLAGFKALLYRHTAQGDLTVAMPIANRTRPEVETLVGFFVNTLLLRSRLDARMTFRDLLGKIRETTLEAYAHQDLPFERLVEALQPERRPGHLPLAQVYFALQNAPTGDFRLEGVDVARLDIDKLDPGVTRTDLVVTVEEAGGHLGGAVQYSTDLFEPDTVKRLAARYETLLRSAVADPGRSLADLAMLPEAEERTLLETWNDTRASFPRDRLAHELFEEVARSRPDALAVSYCGETITYAELDRRANVLAGRLRRAGVGPEDLVAVLVERSPDLVTGALAALKAGAAYVPLDPANPKERLAFILGDTRAKAVLVQKATLPRLPDLGPSGRVRVLFVDGGEGETDAGPMPPGPRPAPENLAYVIYTSGSTGQPKGVAVEHRNLLNLVYWHRAAFGVTADDRGTQVASPGFDASVWEVWPYLTVGASLLIMDDEVRSSPADVRDWLIASGATICFLPTPLAEEVLSLSWPERPALRCLLTGGDRLSSYPPPGLGFRLINNYGPTENTVVATFCPVEPEGTGPSAQAPGGRGVAPPIGRPVANGRVYLLDPWGNLAPIGAPGELYIAGSSVARGYLGRPDLTAERFLPDPFSGAAGERMYRTGDLGRHQAGGGIDFLGRTDFQVKLRGFRIELGEIESAIRRCPGVREAAVARVGAGPRERLAAYVVLGPGPVPGPGGPGSAAAVGPGPAAPDSPGPATGPELRRQLEAVLPDYMIPSYFVFLPALPQTASGKIDRRALPVPGEADLAEFELEYTPPSTPTEEAVATVWSRLLGVARVGGQDNFFSLGGHSLLAMRAAAELEEALGMRFPVRTLFAHPVVSELAAELDRLRAAAGAAGGRAAAGAPDGEAGAAEVAASAGGEGGRPGGAGGGDLAAASARRVERDFEEALASMTPEELEALLGGTDDGKETGR